MNEDLREVKRLTAQAASHVEKCPGCVDLSLALDMLVGLVEGHRHAYVSETRDGKLADGLTGPMQAMEGR